jgi:hypothetical protein
VLEYSSLLPVEDVRQRVEVEVVRGEEARYRRNCLLEIMPLPQAAPIGPSC